MERILFLVHAEHHLMFVSSVVADCFADPRTYDITILRGVNSRSRRFDFQLNLNVFPHVKWEEVSFDQNDFSFNSELFEKVNRVLRNDFCMYVGFLEQHPLNVYLSKKLARRGTRICLAPDGSKPYGKYKRLAILARLRATYRLYRFLFVNRLYVYSPYFVNWNYARLREIDEVWVPNAVAFSNETGKTVKEVAVLESEASVSAVSRIFGFDAAKKEVPNDRVAFYVNQPLEDKRILDFELAMLRRIAVSHSHSLVIKVHPNTPQDRIDEFSGLAGTYIIQDTMPAELYIANLRDSVVLSFWSSASFNNNPTCRFYWLYPMLEDAGLMLDWMEVMNPTSHILEVNSLEVIFSKETAERK